MRLNPAQTEAVRHKEGPMLVLAGPGSGKTRVITERTKYLVTECGIPAEHILVITFTRAAAQEMQERFMKSMGDRRVPVTFGTFHAVFFQMLKAAYGYTASSIVTEEERTEIIRAAMEKEDLELDDEADFIQGVLSEIGIVKNDRRTLDAYEPAHCDKKVFIRMYRHYEEQLHRIRKMDFDDMLVYCYELLSQRPDILAGWQRKFRYILVDEFQDANRIQYDITRLLAGKAANLFIVGDDDQSIYRFRGARPEIMQSFLKDYPGARQVLLDVNYRSTSPLTRNAFCLISHNSQRFSKNIKASRGEGLPVAIHGFKTMREETAFIVEDIRKKLQKGVSPDEIAVLYRIGTQPRSLLEKLMEYNLPFRLREGLPDIYHHWIARDLIAYIHIAMGDMQRKYFYSIMNRPNRYISREALSAENVSFEQLREFYKEKDWMTERIDSFWYDTKMIGRMDPYAAIAYIRHAVGYEEYIREYANVRKIPEEELLDILEELAEGARGYKTFEEWFEHIREYQEEWKLQMQKKRQKQAAVTFTTMHGAKGLEYSAVYILEANEEITPHRKALTSEELEEERRMFYVAMTRAKDELNICWVKERYSRSLEPSRFLSELYFDRRELKEGCRIIHKKYGEESSLR